MATFTESKPSYVSPALYLASILLFLLPFVEVRCNDVKVAENTGLGLAIGSDFTSSGEINSYQDSLDKFTGKTNANTADKSGTMYELALAALIIGAAGFVLSLASKRSFKVKMVMGILGAVALIALMIQLKIDVKGRAGDNGGSMSDDHVKVSADFTPWYYLSVICFLIVAFYNYKNSKPSSLGERPPKNAPQIKIENPGEQSEFPSAASESEIG